MPYSARDLGVVLLTYIFRPRTSSGVCLSVLLVCMLCATFESSFTHSHTTTTTTPNYHIAFASPTFCPPLPILFLISKIRGKLALEIQIAFPTIMDNRLEDSGGMLSAVHAVEFIQVCRENKVYGPQHNYFINTHAWGKCFLVAYEFNYKLLTLSQGQYRGLILRRMMAAGDKEGLQNYSENRQRQVGLSHCLWLSLSSCSTNKTYLFLVRGFASLLAQVPSSIL